MVASSIAVIREYIRKQEHEDIRLDQLNLWRVSVTFRWPKQIGAASATPSSLRAAQLLKPRFCRRIFTR